MVPLRVNAPSAAALRFRRLVQAHYRKFGRHGLPWRKTENAYKILVSEIMLQQTQVERVTPFYKKFIKRFPTAKKLAEAPLSEVLKAWQGLGYNRRAKMLRETAALLSSGKLNSPKSAEELEKLPGVGPYTARAVAAFAYNENVIFIETNIRTAVIHHFFPGEKTVSDSEIEEVLAQALPRGKAREWYSALMDYGAYLKKTGVSHNARDPKYAKQPKFAGSLREARGAILRELARGAASPVTLTDLLGPARRVQMRTALRALFAEGLVEEDGGDYTLAA